jgi:hypothetical protein
MLPECRRGVIDLIDVKRKGEMLRGPFSLVFLQHQHTSLASCS